jgi:hypothetical protein
VPNFSTLDLGVCTWSPADISAPGPERNHPCAALGALAYDGGGPRCFPLAFVAVGSTAADDPDLRLRFVRGCGHAGLCSSQRQPFMYRLASERPHCLPAWDWVHACCPLDGVDGPFRKLPESRVWERVSEVVCPPRPLSCSSLSDAVWKRTP